VLRAQAAHDLAERDPELGGEGAKVVDVFCHTGKLYR
jgi:hypothetical protein